MLSTLGGVSETDLPWIHSICCSTAITLTWNNQSSGCIREKQNFNQRNFRRHCGMNYMNAKRGNPDKEAWQGMARKVGL